MRLVSWNVNGIRAVHRKGMFLPMVEALEPAIICLQETKAEQDQSAVDLAQYEEYWNSSTRKKGYSGTAIFSSIKPENVIQGLPQDIVNKFGLANDSYGDPNTEGRVITAEYKDFYLANAYTPNAKPDLSRLELRHKSWDPAFLSFMKRLEKNKPVIFCGDLNVAHTPLDLANPKANEGGHGFTLEERSGIDAILNAGYEDVFRNFHKGSGYYTWWSNFGNARSRNVGWRIDYFFVSSALISRVQSAEIHPNIHGSDHCPVSIELKV